MTPHTSDHAPHCSCCLHPTRLLSSRRKTPNPLIEIGRGVRICASCDGDVVVIAAANRKE